MAGLLNEDIQRTTQEVDVRPGWLRHGSDTIDE
jgi:hypothetical protein